jgi:cell division septum initiation protein DivIVA
LLEIATARHRIADARAALAEFDESEHACIGAILDAQRALRDERRANERAVAAVHASAEAEAEQLLREARARARYAPLRAVEAEPKVHMNGSAMAGAAVNGRRFAPPRFPGDRG